MASGYRPGIGDAGLRACLGSAGAVVIEGPKACGKIRLAQQLAASTVLLDVDTAARQALAVDPALVLEGEPVSCTDPGLAVADLAELVCRGGWPAQLERPLAAVCGSGYGFRRADGIAVVPVGALGP